jgi:DNA/RNA-binding domain of Phe-tRNA-synthetase-like protein
MEFQHAAEIWSDYPELVPGVLAVHGVTPGVSIASRVAKYTAIADQRLASQSEGELPEIQAWRRTFSRMGLKPTQYRCASEALLRRYRKEGTLPQIHPLVDLCNALSLAFAIPIAAFDIAKVADYLEVRYADGSETYEAFSGDTEHPDPREVIFADGVGRAHARRWTNRQGAYSAVRGDTTAVLIVAEAMHDSARRDVELLISTLVDEVGALWPAGPGGILTSTSPRFELGRE